MIRADVVDSHIIEPENPDYCEYQTEELTIDKPFLTPSKDISVYQSRKCIRRRNIPEVEERRKLYKKAKNIDYDYDYAYDFPTVGSAEQIEERRESMIIEAAKNVCIKTRRGMMCVPFEQYKKSKFLICE